MTKPIVCYGEYIGYAEAVKSLKNIKTRMGL